MSFSLVIFSSWKWWFFYVHDGNSKHWSPGTIENAQNLPGITNNSTRAKNTRFLCIRKPSGIISKSIDEMIVQNFQCTVDVSGPCKNGNICFLESWTLGCINIFPGYLPNSLLVAKKLLHDNNIFFSSSS